MTAPAATQPAKPWLVPIKPCDHPRLTLICFPFGGGGASVFFPWRAAVPADVEMWALRLPGRESRIAEPFVSDASAVVAAVVGDLAALRDRRLVFYGHSLGAGLAYQTAIALRELGAPLPALLIASGRLPPHKPYLGRWGERSDAELADRIRALGGIPEDAQQQQAFISLALPKIRADFQLNDALFYGRAAPVFGFPITIINGTEDPLVDRDGLAEWREHTTGRFASFTLPGDHFFVQARQAEVLAIVVAQLAAIA